MEDKNDFGKILNYRREIEQRLANYNIDPLVVNCIKILIEDGHADTLGKVCGDYSVINKKFRGEIDAVLSMPQQFDETTVNQIKQALEKANPGKKLTLTTNV